MIVIGVLETLECSQSSLLQKIFEYYGVDFFCAQNTDSNDVTQFSQLYVD